MRREHANPPHPLGLLRACRERQRRRAAEHRHELAASHCLSWLGPRHQSMKPRPAKRGNRSVCSAEILYSAINPQRGIFKSTPTAFCNGTPTVS
jgi:hypothetical protein